MKTKGVTVPTRFLAVGALLVLGLILFAPLVVWLPTALGVAFLYGVMLLTGSSSSKGDDLDLPSPLAEETALPFSAEFANSVRITDVTVPSRWPDYHFLLSATVVWVPVAEQDVGVDANLPALAVQDVLRRACEVTSQRAPGQATLVQYELGAPLGTMRPDHSGRVQSMARTIRLVLPEHDRERLDRLATLRKDKAVWEHERTYEQSKRQYLGDDVLKDPGSAVVWWLTKNEDRVDRTVQDIGLLAQLASAANNTDVPEIFQSHLSRWQNGSAPADPPSAPTDEHQTAADHFGAMLRSLDLAEDERAMFAQRMAKLLNLHGRLAEAEEIALRFAPAPPAPPPEDEETGGNSGTDQ